MPAMGPARSETRFGTQEFGGEKQFGGEKRARTEYEVLAARRRAARVGRSPPGARCFM